MPLRKRPLHKRRSRRLPVAAVAALGLLAGGVATSTQSQAADTASASLSAKHDTYVTQYAPSRVSGANEKLAASAQQAGRKVIYLRFDVHQVPKRARSVTAKLTLRARWQLPADLRLHAVASDSWTESSATWRNRPALGALHGTRRPSATTSSVTFDLSSRVRGNGKYSMAVSTTDATRNAAFFSSEASSHRPSLSVRWQPPSGSPAPSGTPSTPKPAVTPTPKPPTTPPTTPPTSTPNPAPSSGCTVSAKLVPSCGAWWGVAPNPLGGESWDQALGNFEAQMGRPAGIAHYYHRDGQLFPTASEIARAREPGKNRLLYLNWKPATDRTWAQVANGAADARIDALSEHIKRTFPERFFLSIYHEPEDNVQPAAGSGNTAADYRAMFRHTVNRLRANGVHNAVIVMNYMGIPRWGTEPWFETLYPGDDVVDWIAEDPYSFGTNSEWRAQFGGMVNRREARYPSWPGFYTWATTEHPSKPIMLGEWGVDEIESTPSFKPGYFDNALDEMQRYPKVKAMVYWNQNEFDPVGKTRIDSSPAALAAYKRLSAKPYVNPAVP